MEGRWGKEDERKRTKSVSWGGRWRSREYIENSGMSGTHMGLSSDQVFCCGRKGDPDWKLSSSSERPLDGGLSIDKRVFQRNTLMEITERLENHPQEVVILACRNFDGMMEDLHKYLMGCIKNISGDMLCPCELSLAGTWAPQSFSGPALSLKRFAVIPQALG
ncbi:hypothetical protein MJT46_019168 [Ovis ammon polii x Ovis aries]|nr:hypothetical protein MJT46_019168 [Ovis ammon polii x Ovis aries]